VPNDSITLLRHRLKQRGVNLAHISTAAEVMCEILDEKIAFMEHDRNRQSGEIKALKARLDKLETKGQSE
jgi:hypothetical protein